LVRVALVEKRDLPGMNIQNTFSIHKRRKLETKKVAAFEIDEDEFCMNDDDTESDNDYSDGTALDENKDNDNDEDVDEDEDEVVTSTQITQTTTVEPLKKKVGRPPKIHSALVISPVQIVKKRKIKKILVEKRNLPKRQCINK
jgi:hypothetical protein